MLKVEIIKLKEKGSSDEFKQIVGETSTSISHSSNEIDTSSKHTGQYATSIVGRFNTSVSISGALNASSSDYGYKDAVEGMRANKVYEFQISTFESGAQVESGELIITEVSKEIPDQEKSTLSITGKVQNATTFTTQA